MGHRGSPAVLLLILAFQAPAHGQEPVPAGDEFQVNEFTTSVQRNPALARAPGGNFVIAWDGAGRYGDGQDIFARRFDALGRPLGLVLLVNHSHTTGAQCCPAVAVDGEGSFLVVWNGPGPEDASGLPGGVRGRRFDSAGRARGAEFLLNAFTTGTQSLPAVAAGGAGFVAVWESYGQDGDRRGIFGRRIAGEGALGPEFQVNTYTTGFQGFPAVAAGDEGNFVAVWESGEQLEGERGIFAQVYDSAGARVGEEFQVSGDSGLYPGLADVAADASGDFVVAWEAYPSGSARARAFARLFESTGLASGGEFEVAGEEGRGQYRPRVAAEASGEFVVVWEGVEEGGGGLGLFGLRRDAQGQPEGGVFQVNASTTGDQCCPVVAADASGDFVVAWESYGQDGSEQAVVARTFSVVEEDGEDGGGCGAVVPPPGGPGSGLGAALLAVLVLAGLRRLQPRDRPGSRPI